MRRFLRIQISKKGSHIYRGVRMSYATDGRMNISMHFRRGTVLSREGKRLFQQLEK